MCCDDATWVSSVPFVSMLFNENLGCSPPFWSLLQSCSSPNPLQIFLKPFLHRTITLSILKDPVCICGMYEEIMHYAPAFFSLCPPGLASARI